MGTENDLGKDPIGKLVVRLALPSMAAQFVNVLYSIVDRIFIGNIPEIGETALAGVGITGPIVTLLGSFAFWVGIGGAPLLSIRLGENHKRGAERILANCFVMMAVFAVILTIVSLLLKDNLLWWFGASEHTFIYADQYMTIYVLGTIFAFMATGMNQFIICQGFAKTGMKAVFIGALANIILDPIFIFVFHLGVSGAALATIISQALSAAYVLYFLFGKQTAVKITFGHYSYRVMRTVLTIGVAPFSIIAFDSILIITLNTVLSSYATNGQGDMLITCATIVQSFMMLVTMPLGGITGGTQSVLGYNYGAGEIGRIKSAQKYILLICVIFTTIMFVIAQLFPGVFVALFTQNTQYMDLCTWAIRVYTLGIIPLAFQYTIVDGFTGMGIVRLSMPLSFSRKAIYFICVFIFPAIWGAQSVFFAEPIIDIIAGIVSTVVYLLLIDKTLNRRVQALSGSSSHS